jgi:DNA-binding beta-propeller fold protein YncE
MKLTIKLTVFVLMVCFSCSTETNYISPIDMEIDKKNERLYIADFTSEVVRFVDLKSKKIFDKVNIGYPLKSICFDEVNQILYGATFENPSKIFSINVNTNKLDWIGKAEHSASDIKLYQKDKLLISNIYSNTISVFNLKSKKSIKTIKTKREPIAIEVLDNNIWVANQLPSTASNFPITTIEVFDSNYNKLKDVKLPNGTTILADLKSSKDNKYVAATHLLAHYQYPTNQIEKGWIYNNCVSLIDTKSYEVITITLDDLDKGASNPNSIEFSEDGKRMIVSHSGTDELSIIDYEKLLVKLQENKGINNGVTDYSFLVDIRKRVDLGTEGANKIITVGQDLYVTGYYSGNVVKLKQNGELENISLGKQKEADIVRNGEIAFHTGKLCFQNWMSCASCHPGDARVDGLNWDLLNDGVGNPKNTKSMLHSHVTAPSMITGIRASAQIAVRAGMKHMFLYEFKEETAKAIDEYLMSLKAVESPNLIDGKLSERAQKGKVIFEKADCAKCHTGEYYTDLKMYNVGTGVGKHKSTSFDTPTLKELWRTAPYLYDGRANTIMDVLTKDNKNDLHGKTSNLNQEELDCLQEYLLSL